jgi:hypothetical protein
MAKQMNMTASDMTEKWLRNAKAGVQDAIAGVQRVTENPATKAIAKKDKMKQNWIKSMDDGTWEKSMGKVKLPDWQEKTAKKMQERMGAGIEAAESKRAEFDKWAVPVINEGMKIVADMPDMTLDDNINRSAAMIRHMAKNKYKKK